MEKSGLIQVLVFLSCLLGYSYQDSVVEGCNEVRLGDSLFAHRCDKSAKGFKDQLPPDRGRFGVWISSRDGLRFLQKTAKFRKTVPLAGNGSTLSLKLNHDVKFQNLRGFGAAFTDAAVLTLANAQVDDAVMRLYFGERGLRYRLGRVPIGGTDFSTRKYTYDDQSSIDVDLVHFALQPEDVLFKIPLITKALTLATGPVFLFGSAWTAPPWMKTNGDYIGKGSLKPDFYETWAQYHIRFLREYASRGVEISGLTAGNEPGNGCITDFPFNSMCWTAEGQRDWIANHLGPALQASNMSHVELIILDDQRFLLPLWADVVLGDPVAAKYISGIGVHFYWDKFVPASLLTITHENFPDKYILYTESCTTNYVDGTHKVALGLWDPVEDYAVNIIEDFNNWAVGWVDWNAAVNMTGGPTWKPTGGVNSPVVVDIDREIFYLQPTYFAIGHFSRFVPVGSRRIQVTSRPETNILQQEASYVAFCTPDATTVVVILNRGGNVVQVILQDPVLGFALMEIPPFSIATFQWKSANKMVSC